MKVNLQIFTNSTFSVNKILSMQWKRALMSHSRGWKINNRLISSYYTMTWKNFGLLKIWWSYFSYQNITFYRSILTVPVMKYHVLVDCQESYIFPKDYIPPPPPPPPPKCSALRENITILAPPARDISSVPVAICYIRWSKLMISWKFYVLYDYHKV